MLGGGGRMKREWSSHDQCGAATTVLSEGRVRVESGLSWAGTRRGEHIPAGYHVVRVDGEVHLFVTARVALIHTLHGVGKGTCAPAHDWRQP